MAPWTQNLYAYSGNNPVNYIDPTGHEGIPAGVTCEGSQATCEALVKTDGSSAASACGVINGAYGCYYSDSGQPLEYKDQRYSALGATTAVLVAPHGAKGLSHVGLLTTYGDGSSIGAEYFSFQVAERDSGFPSGPGFLDYRQFNQGTTVQGAVALINDRRANSPDPAAPYTYGISFSATSQAAVNAAQAFGGFAQGLYNLLDRNCSVAVDVALKAAGIGTPGLQAFNRPDNYVLALGLMHLFDRNATLLGF